MHSGGGDVVPEHGAQLVVRHGAEIGHTRAQRPPPRHRCWPPSRRCFPAPGAWRRTARRPRRRRSAPYHPLRRSCRVRNWSSVGLTTSTMALPMPRMSYWAGCPCCANGDGRVHGTSAVWCWSVTVARRATIAPTPLANPHENTGTMKPIWLAIAQLDDPACFGVLVRSVALTFLALVLLLLGSVWGIHAPAAELSLAGLAGGHLRHHWRGIAGVLAVPAGRHADRGAVCRSHRGGGGAPALTR